MQYRKPWQVYWGLFNFNVKFIFWSQSAAPPDFFKIPFYFFNRLLKLGLTEYCSEVYGHWESLLDESVFINRIVWQKTVSTRKQVSKLRFVMRWKRQSVKGTWMKKSTSANEEELMKLITCHSERVVIIKLLSWNLIYYSGKSQSSYV